MSERPRDEAFEALCQVCGIDWQDGITDNQRGRVNAALKELRSIYEDNPALPMMIHERAAAWAVVYPGIPLTPQALTGNWSSIIPAAQQIAAETVRAPANRTNAHAKNNCRTCGDDHIVVVGLDSSGYDLTAPCPDCNPDANADFWVERRKVTVMDSAKVREFLNG